MALRGQTHCNSRKLNSKNPQNTTEVELKKSYGTQWTSCGSERVQNMQRTELRHAEKTQMEKTFSIAEYPYSVSPDWLDSPQYWVTYH